LFLLDYDGTLTELAPTPPEAKPSAVLLEILQQLTADPRNTVVIISGRDRDTLDGWLGDLPIHFAAEHGFWRKIPGVSWQYAGANHDEAWRGAVNQLMHNASKACPGTFTEEKTSSLAWHYRTATNDIQAAEATNYLISTLAHLQDSLGIRIITGNKVIEVQPLGTDKGTAAQHWLQQKQWDFVLAAGDDLTDEDLFAAMPATAYTIKIGPGETGARLRLATPQDLRQLLIQSVHSRA
jgi:trehalose 6-phosphate synthase/phosphatase